MISLMALFVQLIVPTSMKCSTWVREMGHPLANSFNWFKNMLERRLTLR